MARIGVQSSTVKTAFAELGVTETLRRLTGLGYRTVEMSQVAMTADNVAAMEAARDGGTEFAALSAPVTALQPGTDALDTDFAKIVADCRRLGSTALRIPMLPFDALVSREALVGFARTADAHAARLADEGITLAYHNHHLEFARIDGDLVLDLIADTAPRLGIELDVHWVHRGGFDPVAMLARYAGRVRLVHLKDYRIGLLPQSAHDALAAGDMATFMAAFTGVVQFAEVGEGTLDWPAIVRQALASGAEYLFVEQDDTYGRDPFESLASSADHLRRIGYADLF